MKLQCVMLLLLAALSAANSQDLQPTVSDETLKQLSLDGERLVDQEVTRALYGVKEMREVMRRNQHKHLHLMKSLQHSQDKKQGAAQLAQEVTEKLQEAELQCKFSLQQEWEECRPCLEDACKSFYTTTCRRGFSTFSTKVENFFHRVSRQFGQREAPPLPAETSGDILVNQQNVEEKPNMEMIHLEDSFNRLLSQVGTVVNRSVVLVSKMSDRLDRVLQAAFYNHTTRGTTRDHQETTEDPFYPARDSGFLQGVGLDEVLESFFDFGRSVVEEFGAVVTQVFEEEKEKERDSLPRFLTGYSNRKLCKDLRRQSSECWQLQNQCEACQGALLSECPSVRELHVELDEVSQLQEVAREQYEEILSIVQRHTDQTVDWISNMAAEFSWVAELARDNTSLEHSQNIFRIDTVAPNGSSSADADGEDEDVVNMNVASETKVKVNILNSPQMVLSIPGDLELEDPAFIQYVTQEALTMYKEMVRHEDN